MPLARQLWLQDLEDRGDEVGDKLRGAIKLLMISVNCALCKKNTNLLLLLSKKFELVPTPLANVYFLVNILIYEDDLYHY